MTNHEKFKKLSAAFGQLSGRSHDEAWNDAQGVKDQAKEYIKDVFSDAPNVRDQLLDRLDGLFVAPPCCAVNGEFISSSSGVDAQRDFENDIVTAQSVMDDGCQELKRLAEKYR